MTLLAQSLARLNPAQRQAVEATEGPVLVFAGPGTGKTQILTARIGRLLEQGVNPANILALTFTNAAAKNMQERLAKLVGATAYQVTLTTFHSFCGGVIDQYAHVFPVETRQGGTIAELDQLEILRVILEEGSFQQIRPEGDPSYYLRSCLSLITSYKREGVSPDQVAQLATEGLESIDTTEGTKRERDALTKLYSRNQEVAVVYRLYQEQLRFRGMYDYEDMILWVRDALRSQPEIAQEYQERYQYILVDEFQDTNQAQFQLLVELCQFWGSQANVFVVGDPNQSIYRFQGASVSNVLQFWTIFPDCQVITLTEGYRCPPEIYQAAADLIKHNALTDLDPRLQALEEPLHANQPPQSLAIQYAAVANPLAEALFVSQELQRAHDEGTPWSEMAVLYRKHSQAATLEYVLRKLGVPVTVQRGENSLDQPIVLAALAILRTVIALRDGSDLGMWSTILFQPWWGLPEAEALNLLRAAKQWPDAQNSVWWVLQHEERWSELEWKDATVWQAFRDQWTGWQKEINEPVSVSAERILSQAGVFQVLWSDPVWLAQLPALLGLLREAQQWAVAHPADRLEEFLARLNALQEHGLSLTPEYTAGQPDAVTLCTAHAAKGREWERVVLLRVNDKVWSSTRDPNKLAPVPDTIPYAESTQKEKQEDDRRLFYVAITRAKHSVLLVSCDRLVERGETRELLSCPLVLEMGVAEPVLPPADQQNERLEAILTQDKASFLTAVDRQWVRDVVDNFSLSVTALEEYLTCPVAFFFRYLVRVPTVVDDRQVIGQAIHAALERANRSYSQSQTLPETSELLSLIDLRLGSSPLSVPERLAAAERAKKLFAPFYEAQKADWPQSLSVEHFFGHSPPLVFEGLRLVGKVDNVVAVDDLAKTVRVIDYKTGRRKTSGELLRTADDARQPVRQLVFYALLAELDPTFPYTVTEGEFVFLQPTPAGRYKPVRFEILPEWKEQLHQTLRQVRDELQSLQFLDKAPCGKCEVCERLGLRPELDPSLVADTLNPSNVEQDESLVF